MSVHLIKSGNISTICLWFIFEFLNVQLWWLPDRRGRDHPRDSGTGARQSGRYSLFDGGQTQGDWLPGQHPPRWSTPRSPQSLWSNQHKLIPTLQVTHQPFHKHFSFIVYLTNFRYPPSDACERLKDGLTALNYLELSDREEITDVEEVRNLTRIIKQRICHSESSSTLIYFFVYYSRSAVNQNNHFSWFLCFLFNCKSVFIYLFVSIVSLFQIREILGCPGVRALLQAHDVVAHEVRFCFLKKCKKLLKSVSVSGVWWGRSAGNSSKLNSEPHCFWWWGRRTQWRMSSGKF